MLCFCVVFGARVAMMVTLGQDEHNEHGFDSFNHALHACKLIPIDY